MSGDRRFGTGLTGALVASAVVMAVAIDNLTAQTAAGPRFTVLGCLSRETPAPARGGKPSAPVYTLRDSRGEGATYRVEGNEEELRLHVGHTVEVTGSLSPAPATAANPVRTLKASSLIYLSASCIYK